MCACVRVCVSACLCVCFASKFLVFVRVSYITWSLYVSSCVC